MDEVTRDKILYFKWLIENPKELDRLPLCTTADEKIKFLKKAIAAMVEKDAS